MGNLASPQHSVSVAGIVFDDSDRILAVQRRDNAHWEPPGGVLELNETFEAGVAREIFEETGVRVEVNALTGVYKNMPRQIVALVYRCRPVSGTAHETAESQNSKWLTLSEVSELMTPAFAIRVFDALEDSPASRSHNGHQIDTAPPTIPTRLG